LQACFMEALTPSQKVHTKTHTQAHIKNEQDQKLGPARQTPQASTTARLPCSAQARVWTHVRTAYRVRAQEERRSPARRGWSAYSDHDAARPRLRVGNKSGVAAARTRRARGPLWNISPALETRWPSAGRPAAAAARPQLCRQRATLHLRFPWGAVPAETETCPAATCPATTPKAVWSRAGSCQYPTPPALAHRRGTVRPKPPAAAP